jgi:hypothetical protein
VIFDIELFLQYHAILPLKTNTQLWRRDERYLSTPDGACFRFQSRYRQANNLFDSVTAQIIDHPLVAWLLRHGRQKAARKAELGRELNMPISDDELSRRRIAWRAPRRGSSARIGQASPEKASRELTPADRLQPPSLPTGRLSVDGRQKIG